jgi:hypothetical protein
MAGEEGEMGGWSDFELPWFVTLLGKSKAHSGFARLCAEFALTSEEPAEAFMCWYENDQLGVSVYVELGRISAIQFFCQERLKFGGPLTPSFLGTNFDMVRKDIRSLFGEPDQVIEKRDEAAGTARSGIDRYYLQGISVAFTYSLLSGKLEVIGFEARRENL